MSLPENNMYVVRRYMKFSRILVTVCALLLMVALSGVAQADDLRAVFKKVSPAVVEIRTKSVDQVAITLDTDEFVEHHGLGSGVLIDRKWTILTAAHVVQAADKIMVVFSDGRMVPARVVSSAPQGDVAMLQLEEKVSLPEPIVQADSDKVEVGMQVVVVGAPYGLSHSLSSGYISGLHTIDSMSFGAAQIDVFQTDAAINVGNSGGPLLNLDGEMIGIISHIKTLSGGFEGIGFAVTSNQVRSLLEKTDFWSGIQAQMVEGRVAELLNIPQKAGLLVVKVSANSPGATMGLKPSSVPVSFDGKEYLIGGDIILKIGDIEVTGDKNFDEKIRLYIHGSREGKHDLEITYLRAGKVLMTSFKM
jgi:S1-C subfamily serine protease